MGNNKVSIGKITIDIVFDQDDLNKLEYGMLEDMIRYARLKYTPEYGAEYRHDAADLVLWNTILQKTSDYVSSDDYVNAVAELRKIAHDKLIPNVTIS